VYIPAKFSVPLGAGPEASASSSYIAADALPGSARSQWTASFGFGARKDRHESPAYGQFDNFTKQVNKLELHKVVAASSAAAAGVVLAGGLRDITAKVGKDLGCRLAVWAAEASSEPFATADALLDPLAFEHPSVTKDTARQLADAGVVPLADGFYTDNSGIGQAVAAGATEVTSFTSQDSLLRLFGRSSNDGTYSEEKLGTQIPQVNFPIFDFEGLDDGTSAQDHVKALTDKFPTIDPDRKMKYVESITVGTIQCITRANPWFGIPSGIRVTLNLVLGGTTLGVGAFTNLDHYAVCVQNIVSLITKPEQANSPALEALRGFFPAPTAQGVSRRGGC